MKVEAAKKRHAEPWKPPDESSAVVPSVYTMTFGKHKGKTVAAVMQSDAKYFLHLASWKNDVLDDKADLKAALQAEGVLEGLQAQRPQLQIDRASKIMQKIEDEKPQGPQMHPEIRKLRRLQQIEAESILVGADKAEALAIVAPTSKKRPRKYSPSARVLLPHCSICGDINHKCQSCPHRDRQGQGIPDQSPSVVAYLRNKQMAATVSRLKYTQLQLRTKDFESRASKMARAPLARDFLSLARASPGDLARMLLDEQLLEDLRGTPCPRQKCQDTEREGYISSTKTLGKLCVHNSKGEDISLLTAYYSCDVCRTHQSVALYNPIFDGFLGKGAKGVSIAVLGFWNAVEGVPVGITVRQLNISEQLAQHLYFRFPGWTTFS